MDMEVSSEQCSSIPGHMAAHVDHLTNGVVKASPHQLSKPNNNRPSSPDSDGGGKLKRSSSAPMINQLLPQSRVSAPPTPTPPRYD